MLFHSHQHTMDTQCNVQINGTAINQTNNFKILAVDVQDNLLWSQQLDKNRTLESIPFPKLS